MSYKHPTIAEAIGDYLATFRHDHQVSRDAVAQRARKYGAVMTASTVQSIEEGEHAASIANLMVLTAALAELAERPLRLADLLAHAEHVTISERGVSVPGDVLREVLSGAPVELDEIGDEDCLEPTANYRVGSLCETRAAKRLGVTTQELRTAACQLWGRGLEEEILDRVSHGATPQQRGHVTRMLVEQLAQRLMPDRT